MMNFCVCFIFALFADTYLFRLENLFSPQKYLSLFYFVTEKSLKSTVFGDEQEIAMHVGQNVMLKLLKN